MKAVFQFLFPTLKAIATVTAFFIGLGWASYGAISIMVKAEANVVEKKMLAIRDVDFQHFDKRFDRLETLIKEKSK